MSPVGAPSPLLAWRTLLPLALTLLGLLVLASLRLPFGPPEQILAWPGAEVWGHLWVWSWHAQALPSWPSGTLLAEGASSWPVVDPLPTALAALGSSAIGLLATWNLGVLASIALAFVGGAFAARRAGGHALVGGLALAASPLLTGCIVSGLVEDLSLGLLAIALSLILDPPLPKPNLGGNLRPGLALGLALGLLCWCGLYLAWTAAIVALVAGAVFVLRERAHAKRLLLAALLSTGLALPALALQGERLLQGTGHRMGTPIEGFEPLWRVDPWGGADLLAFITPGPLDLPLEHIGRLHPVYLGLSAVILALMAGRSRWWWLLVAALLVSPGPEFHLAGHPTGIPNPFALLVDALPFGDLVKHHSRLFLPGQIALAVLTSLGAARLRGHKLALACGILALDYLLLSPLPWPLPLASARAPDLVSNLDTLPPGPLLQLPMGGPGVNPQRALVDQWIHGRALALNPNIPGPPRGLAGTDTALWLGSIRPGGTPAPHLQPDPCLMRSSGLAVLLVIGESSTLIEEQLGAPHLHGQDGAAWSLETLCPAAPTSRPQGPR